MKDFRAVMAVIQPTLQTSPLLLSSTNTAPIFCPQRELQLQFLSEADPDTGHRFSFLLH